MAVVPVQRREKILEMDWAAEVRTQELSRVEMQREEELRVFRRDSR